MATEEQKNISNQLGTNSNEVYEGQEAQAIEKVLKAVGHTYKSVEKLLGTLKGFELMGPEKHKHMATNLDKKLMGGVVQDLNLAASGFKNINDVEVPAPEKPVEQKAPEPEVSDEDLLG